MRNILQYPITPTEVIGTLDKIEYNPEAFGDITGMVKNALIDFFMDPENMNKILDQLSARTVRPDEIQHVDVCCHD